MIKRFAYAGINAPQLQLRWQRDHPFDLRGLAEQQKQLIRRAEDNGHLVHHAARRTDHQGKGVSSSAALEVAVMQAAVRVFGIDVDAREKALLCQKVENRFPPSR